MLEPITPQEGLCAPELAIRAMTADGKIRGYIAIWGSQQQRDCYGTWFDKQRPPALGLEYLPIPLFYEHGLDDQIGKNPIGRVNKAWVDDSGIGFEGELDKGPFFDKVASEVKRGSLATSSGSSLHLADFDDQGRFVKWYLSELSLTSKPCEPRIPNVILRSNNGSAFRSAVLDDPSRGHNGDCDDCGDPLQSNGITDTQRDSEMKLTSKQMAAIRQLVGAVEADPMMEPGSPVDESTMQEINTLIQKFGGVDQLLAYIQQMGGAAEEISVDPAARTDDPELEDPLAPPPAAPVTTVTAGSQTVTVTDTARGDNAKEIRALQQQIANLERALLQPPPATTPAMRNRTPQSFNIVSDEFAAYDHLDFEDMLAAAQWLYAGVRGGKLDRVSDRFNRAVVARGRDMFKRTDEIGVKTMRTLLNPNQRNAALIQRQVHAIRANELMGSAVSGAGDEWIGVLYDNRLWEKVRQAVIYQGLLQFGLIERQVPQGQESIVLLTEGSDPTWYHVAQTTDESGGIPVAKATSSKAGTGNTTLTPAKIGAVCTITTEFEEDSLIAVIPQLRNMMDISGQEALENLMINGDTETGASTNINLIDGTPTAGVLYLAMNGFLKLPLVTNTANARDGGTLAEEDYLETLKLMGTLGRDAIERSRCVFIVDNSTYYKTLALAAVKTNDVFGQGATIVNGELEKMWGRQLFVSGQMGLANTAGKISATPGNNTLGRLLAVRPDRWTVGFKRRATTELQRWARQDATEIVTFMRIGLKQFNNEAAAVSYNLTV